MTTHSKYPPFRSKLDSFCDKIADIVKNYAQTDAEMNSFYAKVVFLGLNQYINGIPPFLNWDIIYLYKGLQERGFDCRIHDPHIKGSEALSMGLWLGRHDEKDNWGHSYHALILSCPHLFYVQNIGKIAHMLIPNKATVLIDIFGAFSKLGAIGNSISIYNLKREAEKAELMGGMILRQQPKKLT